MTSAYPVFIKTIIFSLVLISITCSIINLVQGVKKYLREFSQTKRAFFALNFNIILIGVLGSLTFGCVYTIAAFFIDKFEAKKILGTESVLNSGYGMNTSEFFERRKQQIMTEDSESLKMRILMPICLSFQLAVAIAIMLLAFARYILVIKSVEFHRFVTTKKLLLGGLQ